MRKVILGLVMLLTLGDSCNNAVVGVQDYGAVSGRVLDAMSNQPIPNAIVSVGSLFTATADVNGSFTMPHVPIGLQQVTARSAGWTTVTVQVRVRKDTSVSAGYLRLVPLTKPDGVPTLAPPPTPTPEVTIVPTWVPGSGSASPEASPTPSAAPSPSP
jgi:hypothetical protein